MPRRLRAESAVVLFLVIQTHPLINLRPPTHVMAITTNTEVKVTATTMAVAEGGAAPVMAAPAAPSWRCEWCR